jgi:hypothetical protein
MSSSRRRVSRAIPLPRSAAVGPVDPRAELSLAAATGEPAGAKVLCSPPSRADERTKGVIHRMHRVLWKC